MASEARCASAANRLLNAYIVSNLCAPRAVFKVAPTSIGEGRPTPRPAARATKRKFGHATLPNLYYKAQDGILSAPGYTFEKARRWEDTGSVTWLAEGSSLKDSSNVLAKIATANSNGSMCLEREAHILQRISKSADNPSLRLIDYYNIPKENGDVVVLLVYHPGPNMLGRYLPASKVNELLLSSQGPPVRPSSAHHAMLGLEEPDLEETEAFDVMDVASFLEFAIQATHCLEAAHTAGIVHREIRANAFHYSVYTGIVRFAHFGNRAISLENSGSPSALVLNASDTEKVKVKEALCYLAPEQTGSIDTLAQDHRTDLYSLGILFWTLLVGRGQVPFEGGPLELLHSIVQKNLMMVQDVRRDIPEVLGHIINKLLEKHPDNRYQSAFGLKADLMECQRRLQKSISAQVASEGGSFDLIPSFPIAQEDRYIEFTLPLSLFGREKELEIIKNVIRNMQTSFSRQFAANKGQAVVVASSSGSQGTGTGNDDESMSSTSATSDLVKSSLRTSSHDQTVSTSTTGTFSYGPDGFMRKTLRKHHSRTQAVIVTGPPGIGKSSLIFAYQAKWRNWGLWGHAKFQSSDSGPFYAVLKCLSSVLRQLMVFHTDVHRFVNALQERLGPQIQNAPLLYDSVPELREILGLLNLRLDRPPDGLSTRELRARFQTLVESVFSVLAETRILVLFLDDLHAADQSTLSLVSALLNSRSRMLVFITIRSERTEVIEHVRNMFSSRSKPVWLDLEPLPYTAVEALVATTLHREKEACAPLSRLIFEVSAGNAFTARTLFGLFHRQGHITFDWAQNCWNFNLPAIRANLDADKLMDATDSTFLQTQLRTLPEDPRKYLFWAALFGESFKVTEVGLMMHWDDSGSSSSDDDMDYASSKSDAESNAHSKWSTVALQKCIEDGWLVQRARDKCSFAHDRYRQAAQAEVASLPEIVRAKMSYKIVLMMMHESIMDTYRIVEHAKKCLSLIREHPRREEVLNVLMESGEEAWKRGGHELAMQAFMSAQQLFKDNPWAENPELALRLFSRIAALANWRGSFEMSNSIIADCLTHLTKPEDNANLLRLRSLNYFMQGSIDLALQDTLIALKLLGVDVDPSPTRFAAEMMFTDVTNAILAVGHDGIYSLSRTTDPKHILAIQLLNDAGTNAYWSPSSDFAEVIGLTTVQEALRHGLAPGTGLGFFWALTGAAERRNMYRFSCDLSRLALRIADKHGTNSEKCRARVLYAAMVSGYDGNHIRSLIPKLQEAVKYGRSSGDRLYTGFANLHCITTRLFVCEHLSELVPAAEECVNDIETSAAGRDTVMLVTSILNCVRALGGYTDCSTADSAFDTDDYKEADYLKKVETTGSNVDLIMNWHNAFKVAAYYCLGFFEEAAQLGFQVYTTRERNPNHRHVRYGLFFHSLSLIACLRKNNVLDDVRVRFLHQVSLNQKFIERWISSGSVNNSVWVALVKAEVESLENNPNALKSYDTAAQLAIEYEWLMEEGWCHYLEGCHFIRLGVQHLGGELQRRGISRHSQWGAQGIVNYLNSVIIGRPNSKRKTAFTADAAVQTSNAVEDGGGLRYSRGLDSRSENDSNLSANDLDSILKWSSEISSNMNLFSTLQRLTEIATDISGSQQTCMVIVEDGDYTVATTMVPPQDCQVYEQSKAIRTLEDPLQQAVIRHTLNSKVKVYFNGGDIDARFTTECNQSPMKSVICLPIFSNRGQTFGVLYVSTKYSFPENTLTMLTLLCEQASISISNALLFRSVQAGTRENLKMISAQKDALEIARKSREDALKATKIKSNFLASMSHELRTPFSSFYGLLDLLSNTTLDTGQSEIVQTAKQSCELLLKIIDSILDYSKLEASALKLEPNEFPTENIIADCTELLLPLAAKKLDLSYNIEPNVPPWLFADDARIRQILMNLIGNAVKFTEKGSVTCTISVANMGSMMSPDEVNLKFVIQDTGIGLAPSDVELLFVPFQQADNSSTRRFGGTGLGLSISRQLVKLMNGAIGVESELNVGSKFWFTIPVKIFQSEETNRQLAELEDLRKSLLPTNLLVCSSSQVTLTLLHTFLSGFGVTSLSTLQEVQMLLEGLTSDHPPLDFVIIDDQSDEHASQLLEFLRSLKAAPLRDTKVIQLYTPVTHRSRPSIFGSSVPGVMKMTKPPRRARLLQLLASMKNVAKPVIIPPPSPMSSPSKSRETPSERILFGNVLIAEDNPIAQQLLIKILQRADLKVVATSNGNEALAEWEAKEPGYFTVALFDHHMPICDGVEAAKRLRVLESKHNAPYTLPIVALSADCQESTKQLCLSAGMNAFFSKPLKQVDLKALLAMFGPKIPAGHI